MLLHMTSSRAGIVINITSSPCLTYSSHSPTAFAWSEWVNIYNPGNAAAVPVSHSISITHCCPEQCDRYSTQTILWEHRRHVMAMVWMKRKKQLKCYHKNNFLSLSLVSFASLLCASPITALSAQPHQSLQPLALRAINLHHHLCLDSTGAPSFCHQTGSMPSITHSPRNAEAQKTNKYTSIVTSFVNSDGCCDVSLQNVAAF